MSSYTTFGHSSEEGKERPKKTRKNSGDSDSETPDDSTSDDDLSSDNTQASSDLAAPFSTQHENGLTKGDASKLIPPLPPFLLNGEKSGEYRTNLPLLQLIRKRASAAEIKKNIRKKV